MVRKRGKVSFTTEPTNPTQSPEDIYAEIRALKEAKSEMRADQKRRRRQPKPLEERKALDHMPVIAGYRTEIEARVARRNARKKEREERKLRRQAALDAKTRR